MNYSELISGQDLMCASPNTKTCGGSGECDGATPELGYLWATGAGLISQSDLPYTAKCSGGYTNVDSLAQRKGLKPKLQITGYHRIMFNNRVEPVMQSLVSAGPLAV